MKDFVLSHQNTVTNFLGALAGGAIAVSVLYAFMPNINPTQANSSKAGTVSASSSHGSGSGMGSCSVESASAPAQSSSVVTKAAWLPSMPNHHSVEKVWKHTTTSNNSHTHTSTSTNTNSNNTTTTNSNSSNSTATGTGGLIGAGVSNNLLNNSLNGNEVNVPILSGNDVNVLNNSDVLSENDILNNSNVLNDVLDAAILGKTVSNVTGGLL